MLDNIERYIVYDTEIDDVAFVSQSSNYRGSNSNSGHVVLPNSTQRLQILTLYTVLLLNVHLLLHQLNILRYAHPVNKGPGGVQY